MSLNTWNQPFKAKTEEKSAGKMVMICEDELWQKDSSKSERAGLQE